MNSKVEHNKNEIVMDEEANRQGSSFRSDGNDFQYSDDEKRLVKKISWTLLPLVWCIVFVQVCVEGKAVVSVPDICL